MPSQVEWLAGLSPWPEEFGLGRMRTLLAALEPSGKRDLDAVLDSPPEERLCRFASAANDDVRACERGELLVGEHRDRPVLDNGELLRRDLLPRLPEDVGVLEADVREQHDV